MGQELFLRKHGIIGNEVYKAHMFRNLPQHSSCILQPILHVDPRAHIVRIRTILFALQDMHNVCQALTAKGVPHVATLHTVHRLSDAHRTETPQTDDRYVPAPALRPNNDEMIGTSPT